jgi:hypothetical protein
MDAASRDAAGRALVRRIDLFVVALERNRRNPNRREAFHVMEALRCLQAGQWEAGEEAMSRAERVAPLPPDVIDHEGIHDHATTAQLRSGLQALLDVG